MTAVPHLILRLSLKINGKQGVGFAADHLPPKWFTKDPASSLREEVEDMITVICHACDIAVHCKPADTVFSLWYEIYINQKNWAEDTTFPSLLWGFGVSLVERALIDGFCKVNNLTFAQAVRKNALGMRLDILYKELRGISPAQIVPSHPIDMIQIRHTIGLGDPVTDEDVAAEDTLNDGLPQSLEDIIKTYALKYFKIKLSGDIQTDTDRLRYIAEVLNKTGLEYAFTLDGNENYHALTTFKELWDNLASIQEITTFLSRLIFIEQPLHRDIALADELRFDLDQWPDHPAIIIDESDGRVGDLKKALEIGYAGTSYKNCKGFFKGFANASYLHVLRHQQPGKSFILSSEDLSTVGPISLLQDLAVLATLGLQHTERNGHHYFKGLSMLPDLIQDDVLHYHSDLFKRHVEGFPTLDISDGGIKLGSIIQAPFGMGFDMDTSKFMPLEDWHYDMLDMDD